MRREVYSVGSYVHVFNRGTKRMNIVRDDDDRWRFLKLARYLNDDNVPRNWERDVGPDYIRRGFARPDHWPAPKPYVSILAYCLLDNHFHFLLRESVEGGIAKFMHRVGTSMSKCFNEKYGEQGTLFEGTYQARVVATDTQLQYLQAYIHVKNPLEKYPGGIRAAMRQFDNALEWLENYHFAGMTGSNNRSTLIDLDAYNEVLLNGKAFRDYSRDVMQGRRLPYDWERLSIDI